MSVRRLPPEASPYEISVTPPRSAPVASAEWGGPPRPEPFAEPEGIPWARYVDAVRRHTLLIIILAAAGSVLGLFAAKRVKPVYDAQATIWINATGATQTGPIRAGQLLPSTSWVDLLRSYAIIDPVVRRLRLNVHYKLPGDSVFFVEFESAQSLKPGAYVLSVDSTGRGYRLATVTGNTVDQGAVGDSIGRAVGFKWQPPARLLTPRLALAFSIATPRNVSMGLVGSVHVAVPEDGQFLKISLSGADPQRTARTVNAWAEQLVASSGDLKKGHLLQFKEILAEQLGVAEQKLRSSESELERFRVNTITLPSGAAPTTAGSAGGTDPIMANFFQQKVALDEVRDERVALERMVAEARGGPMNTQGFLQLPSILNNTPQLRTAIEELSSRQATLRSEQQYLTDANPRIKQLNEAIRVLQQETIPRITMGVLNALRAREPELGSRITERSQELRAIPTRATEEMRLARQVSASENLYNSLKARYEEVSLSEAQTTPDLSVLDFAVPPPFPSSNDAPRMLMLAVLASVGLSLGIALLHDRMDKRFRYPEQATHELGLAIAGTVPRFKPNRRGKFQIETMSQAVESFRTLRLALRYDFPGDVPVVLGVSSPAAGDGKSLVSSNLALAFAGAGSRTLLIDGDVRRGGLHTTFETPVSPGLTEYLNGFAGVDSIVRSTSSENLYLIPRGARNNRAPELLVSDLMGALILAMRRQFDVVIIDSPPLVAGMDAYALGAAAGSMLIVLRPAVTDRKLAAAKLEVLDRLPIRILGAVLNGVPDGGAYRYYGSDYYYAGARPTEPLGDLATPGGLVLRA
ncbi:MAG TPA: polysaccharide biosynthesis tyrosine autokinase [Gemmatimonadaceae bacterium]